MNHKIIMNSVKNGLKKSNTFVLIVSCMLLAVTSFAQPNNDRVKSLKIAHITEKLSLTPDEAKVFWPVYDKFQDEMKQLRQKMKQAAHLEDGEVLNITDQEAEKLLNEMMAFKQSEVDLLKKYNAEFRKVLPVKKVVLLYKAEQDFKRKLIKSMGAPKK
jgi:hypothetical protein